MSDTKTDGAIGVVNIDIKDLPNYSMYMFKGVIDDPINIPKDASEYDIYTTSSGEYSYIRASDNLIYRFKGHLMNIEVEMPENKNEAIKIFDIDISDLLPYKEYTYKGMINDLSEIPKDASIYDLYTFMDDGFIYARKNDNALYRVINTPLDIINKTSDSPSDREAKFDQGKPQLTLVPRQIIFDIAKVREYGVKKYKDPDNWRRVSVDRYRDAAFRHFMAYLDDPYGVDEESGLPHLAHLACNIAFLCELQSEYGFYPEDTNE